eukprot:Nitzschia sp. Nitz4//scaffold121_size67750//1680//2639//NITZ4_006058-RA/size67750-augustus-gene-0.117-mRNA-1//1//CDS//3329534321//3296//frame0
MKFQIVATLASQLLLSLAGRDALVVATEVEFSREQLESMSQQELEAICADRGFEIEKDAKDPSTGEVIQFSHADFVDAALQCLGVDGDLNELLDENADEAEPEVPPVEEAAPEEVETEAESEVPVEEVVEETPEAVEEPIVEEPVVEEPVEEFHEAAEASSPEADVELVEPAVAEPEATVEVEEPPEEAPVEEQVQEEVVETPVEETPEPEETEVVEPTEELPPAGEESADVTVGTVGSGIVQSFIKRMQRNIQRILELVGEIVRKPLAFFKKAFGNSA